MDFEGIILGITAFPRSDKEIRMRHPIMIRIAVATDKRPPTSSWIAGCHRSFVGRPVQHYHRCDVQRFI